MSKPAFGPFELHEPIDLHSSSQRFFLHPVQLAVLTLPTTLKWSQVEFKTVNRKHVLDKRGVYAFVVKSPFTDLPPHGYVMYMGITGDDAATRTLRIRYADYLRHQGLKRTKKRAGIYDMLNIWKDCLYFYFAPVDAPYDLGQIEIALNDCLIPPFVQNDFSAHIRASKSAVGLR